MRQQTNHETALVNKYNSDDFPHGVVFAIIDTMKLKHMPKDTEQLVFFHNQVLKSEIECVKLLKKKQNPICM